MKEKITTFEGLDCWKLARELRNEVSKLIKTFPDSERYELVSQMRRASRSVTHNIAEGYGRFHYKENSQFNRISRGSLYEILDQLITARDENYIDEIKYKDLREKTLSTIKVLNGYINYLVKRDLEQKRS